MRRRCGRVFAGLALAAVTLSAVSGCAGLPAGTDGDLVNQWPAIPAAAGWAPVVGDCHSVFELTSTRNNYKPVDCVKSHSQESIFIGEFTGEAAARTSPPLPGSPEMVAAWGQCEAKATEFVGAPWRHGKLAVKVSIPSSGAWGGGARWYICQLGALLRINDAATNISRSLKGELAGDSLLKNGCYKKQANEETDDAVPCTSPHEYEFAGTFDPGLTWDQLQNSDATIKGVHAKCRSVIAAYVGVPDDGNMKYRTGTSLQYPGQTDWESGDHHVRCYIWPDKVLTRSLKGTGTGGLPIRYA
jgi:hypothetical protein